MGRLSAHPSFFAAKSSIWIKLSGACRAPIALYATFVVWVYAHRRLQVAPCEAGAGLASPVGKAPWPTVARNGAPQARS